MLQLAGLLHLARRDGSRRWFDLAERLIPRNVLERRVSEEEQIEHTFLARHRDLGLASANGVWVQTDWPLKRKELVRRLTERGAPEVVVVGVSSAAGGRLAISRVPRVPCLSPRRYGKPDFSCENTDNRPSRHIFSCFPIQPRSSCWSSGRAVQKLASPAITCRMTLRMRRGRLPLGGTIAAHDA
jgi:hypothetical protein